MFFVIEENMYTKMESITLLCKNILKFEKFMFEILIQDNLE